MIKRVSCIMGSFLIVFLLAAYITGHRQTIWYVDGSRADGNNTGEDWENAFVELQSALGVAVSGDEIRVASGVYRPDFDVAVNKHTNNREMSFRLKSGVRLYGGYAGYGSSKQEHRDVNANKCILSGDLAGNDGLEITTKDDNSYHVLVVAPQATDCMLDGVTITGGHAYGPASCSFGGGIYNAGGRLSITNCRILGNSARFGGGMCVEQGDVAVVDTILRGNRAIYGGGLWSDSGGTTFKGCIVSGNEARYGGGGVYCSSGAPAFGKCEFTGNTATFGGGICSSIDSAPVILSCEFIANVSSCVGGGVYSDSSDLELTDCVFKDNVDKAGTGELAQVYNAYLVDPPIDCSLNDSSDRADSVLDSAVADVR